LVNWLGVGECLTVFRNDITPAISRARELYSELFITVNPIVNTLPSDTSVKFAEFV
jgi:hypothetical protein